MAAKKPYAPVPSPLPTPHVMATPTGPRPTPVAPEHYTRADLLNHNSTDYAKLRHRAEAINAEKLDAREGMDWRKSALTDTEKYYLWNSQYGLCGNGVCTNGQHGARAQLDERSMTIDHLAPKHFYEAGTWDIRNFTILCNRCNASKGVNYLPGIVRPTLAADSTYGYATGGGDFKGK